jgi:HEAT repeat protein
MVFAAAGLAVMAVVGWKSWRIGVEHWYIAKLESEDLDTREHAAARLAAMASVRAVPYLIEALARHPDDEDGVTLWSIGGPRKESRSGLTDAIAAAGIGALPGLERKLRSEVPMERFWAARMIGRLGDGAERAAGSLFPLLSDESPRMRSEAAGALGPVGWRSPAVLQRVGEALRTRASSSELRQSSIEALAAAARIATLIRGEVAVRLEAGETASTVLAHLAAALEDEDDAVRRKAILSFFDLLKTGSPPAGWPPRFDAGPALVRLAAHEEPTVRAEAVLLLARTGRFSGPALAVLARALGDPEGEVRKAVRLVLKVMGPGAIPVWIAALEMDRPMAWEAAADALAGMGVAARPAWPLLLERLLDAREGSVPSLAAALGRIGAASGIGVPDLISALESPAAAARRGAAEALGHYGPAASAAGPALLEALADENPSVRRAAALAVVSTRGVPLEALAEKAVPVLAACLSDEDPLIWWRAGEALGSLGPGAKGAVPALTRALRDRHGLVNPWALRALEAIGPEAEAAVPAILSIIAEDDGKSRLDAVRAIRAIGPDLAIPTPVEPR